MGRRVKKPDHFSDNPVFRALHPESPDLIPHYKEIGIDDLAHAYDAAIKNVRRIVHAIKKSPEKPTLENTLIPLDEALNILGYVTAVYEIFKIDNPSPETTALGRSISRRRHYLDKSITTDRPLFNKVKTIYKTYEKKDAADPARRLVEAYYGFFPDLLNAVPKKTSLWLKKIEGRLKILIERYDYNLKMAENSYMMVLTNPQEVAGIPDDFLRTAQKRASLAGHKNAWAFNCFDDRGVILEFCDNRDVRKRYYLETAALGTKHPYNNLHILKEILKIRYEQARIFRKRSFLTHTIQYRVNNKRKDIYSFLESIKEPIITTANQDLKILSLMGRLDGLKKIEPWDVKYYERKAKDYYYSSNLPNPSLYFEAHNVVSGALELCERIFDVSISINITAHKSHEDALNYDVFDKNGQKLATLTFDLFHRPGKENTSHCYSLLSPCTMHGKRVPVPVFMSFNFSKTPESKYTRLNFDDVTTILHELGHAFQVIFNQNPVETPFPSVSGLAPVDEDLDEVVSQLMENFAYEESFLDRIGFDYESGNKIPDQVKKILSVKRKIFAGTNLMYCLMTSYLDLEIHNRNPANLDIPTFERQTLKRIFKKLADNKEPELHNLPHIVTHSLGAGYYRYLQASVYETDIYEMFNDKALGDEEKRTKLLRFLRESSLCPDKAFKNLRGRAVDSNAFIRNYGLKGLFNIIQASKSVNLTDNISQPMPILT